MTPATLTEALQHFSKRQPDRVLFRDGTRALTYAEVSDRVDAMAGGLRAIGLSASDRLAVLLPNGIDYLLLWLACARAGVVPAYINPAHLGEVLRHQLELIDATVAVLDPALGPHLGDALGAASYKTILRLRDLPERAAPPELPARHDPMALYFTSGTTGPSKAVVYGHGQAVATALPMAATLSTDDVLFWCNPMFHVAVPHFIGAAIIAGASVAIVPSFSASRFWDQVRTFGATATMMLGAIAPILAHRPSHPDDSRHKLRKVFMVPLVDHVDAFSTRFGVRVMSWFNMTEASTPIHTDGFGLVDGRSCGRVREGVIARLVDDHDNPVPTGQAGELVLRYERPWEGTHGYWRDPDATVRSWRNLWLHTGDVFVADVDGNYRFVDRKKDVIRRRGENIAASEVETAVMSHPMVTEAAAFGVPSPLGEEDLMVLAVAEAGMTAEALHTHLIARLGKHMVPRFIRVQAEALPKTPTGKIVKGPLRELGAMDAWDSERSRE